MKILLLSICLISFSAWSKSEVKIFNEVLIQNVQKDIQNDNDDQFKSKRIGRGPASVVEEDVYQGRVIEQENKIDKNVRQTGSRKW